MRLLAEANERPRALEALRVADDAWLTAIAPTASASEEAAWFWTRDQAAGVLLEAWQPNGRTHDPAALQAIPGERRNDVLTDSLLLALGAANLLSVMVKDTRPDDPPHRVFLAALRQVGELLSESLRNLRENPPVWPDA
jgi:hypothetical protein